MKSAGVSLFSMLSQDATLFPAFLGMERQYFLTVGLKVKTKDLNVTFQQLSNTPVDVNDAQLNVLDKFVMDVYYLNCI